ncbi:hypothetical protein GCM10022235_01350 [Kribbella ginsengisoli]|uniref:Uncharacterized protein n=1 Tax=Kribbella ginsengisoli TaxID=363865 RepID=A0ABP6VKZ7_9ACTN
MAGGPTIRLDGGPGHGQIYFEAEFRDRIKAAQRMHRTEPDAAGWALGYEPGGPSAGGGRLWTWRGVNCHPVDLGDPDLARYGAVFAAELHGTPATAA